MTPLSVYSAYISLNDIRYFVLNVLCEYQLFQLFGTTYALCNAVCIGLSASATQWYLRVHLNECLITL